MKIILLLGQSGTGKTTISKELSKNTDKYNFVYSYTDRPKRNNTEWGHTFVDSARMDLILQRDDVIAQTQIKEKRYCTTEDQFDENKINIYIVDTYGINDTIKSFPQAEIMSILLRRDDVSIESARANRDVAVPAREDVDFLIDNNGSVESVVKTIDVLVNTGLFKKPSHVLPTIEDGLDKIYQQRRYLQEIEQSLEEQRWYRDQAVYNQLVQYVNEKMQKYFKVEIFPDQEPVWDGDNCIYTIIAWYEEEEANPIDVFRLNEILTKNTYQFCSDNNCMSLLYRTHIDAQWEGLRDE